jgi:hypothetical protein
LHQQLPRGHAIPTSERHNPHDAGALAPGVRVLGDGVGRGEPHRGADMGEFCPSPQGDSALAAPPLTLSSPSPATAVRPSYGSCDRRYVKLVFDNLHGSISVDPVSSVAALLPCPCSLSLLASLLVD